jgi:hypothetical protein
MKSIPFTDAGYALPGKATARAILKAIADRGANKR